MPIFDEMARIGEDSRVASVVCVEERRLKKISAVKFNHLLDVEDLTAHKFIRNIGRMVADAWPSWSSAPRASENRDLNSALAVAPFPMMFRRSPQCRSS